MNSRLRTAAVVGAACILSAFTSIAHAPANPCTLLTPAEVQAALGAAVGAGAPISATACQWITTSPTISPAEHVTVMTQSASSYARMKALQIPGMTKSNLSGVGDDAFYATVGYFTSLSVKKGGTVFIIHMYGVHSPAREMTVEKALAIHVAPRV